MSTVHPESSIAKMAETNNDTNDANGIELAQISSSSADDSLPVAAPSKTGPPPEKIEADVVAQKVEAGDDGAGNASKSAPKAEEIVLKPPSTDHIDCCKSDCCCYNDWDTLPKINPCCSSPERPCCMKGESCTERFFEGIGVEVAKRPWLSIFLTCFVILGAASGYAQVEAENRPDKLWIPTGSPALSHKEYVAETWPSQQRIGLWIATCKDVEEGETCNILGARYIQELDRVIAEIKSIEVDAAYAMEIAGLPTDGSVEVPYADNYTFDGDEDRNVERLCFPLGAAGVCGEGSVLAAFRNDVPDGLTDKGAIDTINFFPTQERFCPLTISDPASPCRNATAKNPAADEDACQVYTGAQIPMCQTAFYNYCGDVCPNWLSPNSTLRETDCQEESCPRSSWYLANRDPIPVFGTDLDSIMSSSQSGGGPERDIKGQVVSAEALFGYFFLATETVVFEGSEFDPIAEEWEKAALCKIGIVADADDPIYNETSCANASQYLQFTAQFQRSLGDEFGSEILGDIPLIGGSFGVVIVYLIIMLSRRDYVHSMIGMSIVCILTVGLSYAGCIGLGTYFGWKDNNLNLNIPFLLLGLGVDDAFVISSEFFRAMELYPTMSIQQRTVYAAKHGGVSVLITSATDALAFLVGSSTVLPALSWFCSFCGVGIIMCFLLQIFVFLPALQLNAMRAKANYYDLWCCCKSKRNHEYDKPLGCCGCCKTAWCPPGVLGRLMHQFGTAVTSVAGMVITFLAFSGLLAAGVYGCTQLYKDFQIEWFVPDGSYLKDFYALNSEYFAAGVSFTVYTTDIEYFDYQSNFAQLHYRLTNSSFMDTEAGVTDWHHGFMSEKMMQEEQWPLMDCFTTPDGRPVVMDNVTAQTPEEVHCIYKQRDEFYAAVMTWFEETSGWNLLSNNIKWKDTLCEDCVGECRNETHPGCDYNAGFNASTVGGTLLLNATNGGQLRYDTMTALRAMVQEVFPTYDENGDFVPGGTGIYNPNEVAFPYAREFENWEEVGTIDAELWKNLAICFAVIVVIIGFLIPKPRVAIFVILAIVMSIVDILGFLYFWDITISGVSTIFILISVGLAVDYSAHIAHMFAESEGTARERAVGSLSRIGPSVFNAIMSTLLAVIVLANSSSYIYEVFFRVLCLTVLFAGAHGMWFLPAILALAGGNSDDCQKKEETTAAPAGDAAATKEAPDVEKGAVAPKENESVERTTVTA